MGARDQLQQRIDSVNDELEECADEAIALSELAANAERASVPADPRTVARAEASLVKVTRCGETLKQLASQATLEPEKAEIRILKATLDATEIEIKAALALLRGEEALDEELRGSEDKSVPN